MRQLSIAVSLLALLSFQCCNVHVAALAAPRSLQDTSPSAAPSLKPAPSSSPSAVPTSTPSAIPSWIPSSFPSSDPTAVPSSSSTTFPSSDPTAVPSSSPTTFPTFGPSATPSLNLSLVPSTMPSTVPSFSPSTVPSSAPTTFPTSSPSLAFSTEPTTGPSNSPSIVPSGIPTQYRDDDNGHHRHSSRAHTIFLGTLVSIIIVAMCITLGYTYRQTPVMQVIIGCCSASMNWIISKYLWLKERIESLVDHARSRWRSGSSSRNESTDSNMHEPLLTA